MRGVTKLVHRAGLTVLRTVGECIYCGATDDLEDEHLVPYSLGGTLVLRDASCRPCAGKTSRWEGLISRDSFLSFRTVLNLPTRRPKRRPTSFPAQVQIDGEWQDGMLSLDQMTGVALFPKLSPPGVLEGRPPSSTFRAGVVALRVTTDDGETNPAKRAGVTGVKVPLTFNPAAYMRVLAKIGWCFVVAQYGLDVVEPVIRGIILGEENNVSHWVGGMEDGVTLFDRPATSTGHICVALTHDGWVRSGIRLWSDQGIPEYQVIVGRPLRPLS